MAVAAAAGHWSTGPRDPTSGRVPDLPVLPSEWSCARAIRQPSPVVNRLRVPLCPRRDAARPEAPRRADAAHRRVQHRAPRASGRPGLLALGRGRRDRRSTGAAAGDRRAAAPRSPTTPRRRDRDQTADAAAPSATDASRPAPSRRSERPRSRAPTAAPPSTRPRSALATRGPASQAAGTEDRQLGGDPRDIAPGDAAASTASPPTSSAASTRCGSARATGTCTPTTRRPRAYGIPQALTGGTHDDLPAGLHDQPGHARSSWGLDYIQDRYGTPVRRLGVQAGQQLVLSPRARPAARRPVRDGP